MQNENYGTVDVDKIIGTYAVLSGADGDFMIPFSQWDGTGYLQAKLYICAQKPNMDSLSGSGLTVPPELLSEIDRAKQAEQEKDLEETGLALMSIAFNPEEPLEAYPSVEDTFSAADINTALVGAISAIIGSKNDINITRLHNRFIDAIIEEIGMTGLEKIFGDDYFGEE